MPYLIRRHRRRRKFQYKKAQVMESTTHEQESSAGNADEVQPGTCHFYEPAEREGEIFRRCFDFCAEDFWRHVLHVKKKNGKFSSWLLFVAITETEEVLLTSSPSIFLDFTIVLMFLIMNQMLWVESRWNNCTASDCTEHVYIHAVHAQMLNSFLTGLRRLFAYLLITQVKSFEFSLFHVCCL